MVTVNLNQTFFKEVARVEKGRCRAGEATISAWMPWDVQVLLWCEICTCSKQTLGFSRMQIEELYT